MLLLLLILCVANLLTFFSLVNLFKIIIFLSEITIIFLFF